MPDLQGLRVAVCFPSHDMVHADFALCLADLCMTSRAAGLSIKIVNAKSSIVAQARNNLVRITLDWGATHMLFLDSDMIFPPDTLLRLLRHEKTVVGATYAKRVAPFGPLGMVHPAGSLEPAGPLVEMKHLPTGCMLIDTGVFETLSRPYFRFETDESSGEIRGEDYVFCERVQQAGAKVWCDVALSHVVGHLGQKTHWFADDRGAAGKTADRRRGEGTATGSR